MIIIDLNILISALPELLTALLPGFIFICIYNWFVSRKEMDFSVIALWSLFISFIIRTFYQAGHLFILPSIDFHGSVKVIIYIATGGISALVLVKFRRTKFFEWFLDKVNNKSINDDVWDDIINYNEPIMLKVFLKEVDILYIGRFVSREEKGLESWIVISDYIRSNKANEPQYNPENHDHKSMATINMRDIERVELVYNDGSKIWEKYN